MESVLFTHPETVMPFCVRHYRVLNATGDVVAEVADNHQTLNSLTFDPPLNTDALSIEVLATHGDTPAAIFEVRCYA